MTFTLAHSNIEAPDPANQNLATIMATSKHGDVLTFNETIEPGNQAAIRALLGFASYVAGENAIAWKRDKFDRVDSGARQVMVGGRRGTGRRGDRRRRGPSRFVVWTVLREKSTGEQVIVATHHAIAKADSSAKWRRPLRALGFKLAAAELVRVIHKHPGAGLLLTGDLNTIREVNFPGLAEIEVPTPATFGARLRYDRLFRSADVAVSHVGTFTTRSDHRGLVATVQLDHVVHAPKPDPVPDAPGPKAMALAQHPVPTPPYLGPAAHTSGRGNKPIRRIVIHATVSPCKPGGARAIAKYFRSAGAGGSAHYIVDPAEVVQSVYDDVVAWHAPPNPHSIGDELCFIPTRLPVGLWRSKNGSALLDRAARLVAQQCLAFDVPPVRLSWRDVKAGKHGICGHVDVSKAFGESTHWDPGFFPWRRFMRLVRHYIEEAL